MQDFVMVLGCVLLGAAGGVMFLGGIAAYLEREDRARARRNRNRAAVDFAVGEMRRELREKLEARRGR